MSDDAAAPSIQTVITMTIDSGRAIAQHAGSLATTICKEPGPSQDAAFFEFLYGLMLVMLEELSSGLQKSGISPSGGGRGLVNSFIEGALPAALKERFPAIDLENREVWEWAFQHRQAMEARIDNWSTMPLLPADTKQGTAGTLAWEVSKQASKSANIDPVTNVIAVAAASLGFAEVVVKYMDPATAYFVDTLMAATKPPTMP